MISVSQCTSGGGTTIEPSLMTLNHVLSFNCQTTFVVVDARFSGCKSFTFIEFNIIYPVSVQVLTRISLRTEFELIDNIS
jgi:hypothetical protein